MSRKERRVRHHRKTSPVPPCRKIDHYLPIVRRMGRVRGFTGRTILAGPSTRPRGNSHQQGRTWHLQEMVTALPVRRPPSLRSYLTKPSFVDIVMAVSLCRRTKGSGDAEQARFQPAPHAALKPPLQEPEIQSPPPSRQKRFKNGVRSRNIYENKGIGEMHSCDKSTLASIRNPSAHPFECGAAKCAVVVPVSTGTRAQQTRISGGASGPSLNLPV